VVEADVYTMAASQESTKAGSISWRIFLACPLQCLIKRMDENLDPQAVFLVIIFLVVCVLVS
jgi:hypothetical protein